MKKPFVSVATLLLLLLCFGFEKKQSTAPDAIITIDMNGRGPSLSPGMYGIFFEDINHAADGGLYAELVQNRDFEYNRLPEDMQWLNDSSVISRNGWREKFNRPDSLFAWSLVATGGAKATVQQVSIQSLNEQNPMSAQLTVSAVQKGKAGIANEGYWGISLAKGATYNISFYARCSPSFKGNIIAALESRSGKTYATQSLTSVGADWKKLTAALTTTATDSAARLVLYATAPGTVWFDMVSLFPAATYKNRPNGMRKDLADMLAALHPSFLRFPGGCVAEGATLENRIQWKQTIGDIAQRPGNWNLWRYHTTEGLGYHEFLQLCEDMHMNALYVVNVGMACQARTGECVPMNNMNDYVQDALDALEYAMGDASTKWGSIRAQNGHPAPYKIKYVEIGNENRGPFYQEAYKVFYTAIKQHYPSIITIANEPITITETDQKKYPGLQQEMIDEHYYRSPAFFYERNNFYDNYSREEKRKIYIGEYAVNTADGGLGNLRGALGEAAFMTGMERNADLVTMASYAPTFVNINDRRWNPDIIVFNSSQAFGTPSYYTFQLFSTNRPDYILPTTTSMTAKYLGEDYSNLKGGIGFSGRNTLYRFKNIKVIMDGKDMLNDDLMHGEQNWEMKNDNWVARNGELYNRYDEMKSRVVTGNADWKNYTLSLQAKREKGEDGIHIGFLNNSDACTLNLTDSIINLSQTFNGIGGVLARKKQALQTGKWYDIKLEIKDQFLKCYIDGQPCFDVTLKGHTAPDIYSTAGYAATTKEVIIKLVNPYETPKNCQLKLNGKLAATGTATVLQSASQDDENTFATPKKVAPQTKTLQNVAPDFMYQCPANSISILRLKVAQ